MSKFNKWPIQFKITKIKKQIKEMVNLQPTASIIFGNVQIELWYSRKNPG